MPKVIITIETNFTPIPDLSLHDITNGFFRREIDEGLGEVLIYYGMEIEKIEITQKGD